MYKQSKQLTIKIALVIIVAVVSMVVMAILLSTMQTNLYLESYTQEIEEEFEGLPEAIDSADSETEWSTSTFDETYQSLAQSIAFIANNNVGYEATHAKMLEYQDLLDVDNILVVRRDGTVVAQAQQTQADYSSSRFNQLRTVFSTDEPSKAVEIEAENKDWLTRYYAARIDDDTMVVIEQSPAELRELIQDNGSLESVLKDIDIGQSGYIFAVSALDYVIEYHPNKTIEGTDALQDGIDVANLEDGAYSWMTLNGVSLYCGVKTIDNTYYIAAVPESEMTSSRTITVAVILFAFFAVMLMVVLYGIFVMRENERKGTDEGDVSKIGAMRINKVIVRRAAIVSFVGFLAILVVSFYMQTLFALSSESVSNNEHVTDIVENMDNSTKHAEELETQYGERYLPTCKVVGYILDNNPSLMNRSDLQTLADILKVQTILAYDSSGKLTATNSSYVNYALSDNPEDQSYEFIKILQGDVNSVVQDPQSDEDSGEVWQYIGVPLHNAQGYVDGLVQIAIRPTFLESLLSTADIDNVLDGVKVDTSGFAFAINKEDDTFAYYPPNPRYVGESVFDHGMKENQVKDAYNDYLTIDGTTYYAASAETDDYYIYLAGTEGELMNERIPLTVITGIVALICLLIVFLLLIFEPKRNVHAAEPIEGSESRTFDTTMPGGRTVRTESAASRWINFSSLNWHEKTAWQKAITVLRWFIAALVLVICIAVIFKDAIFDKNSIFSYILGNQWEYGFNIFAITACIMFICVAATAVTVVQWILRTLATILSARGETVCRLLSSFTKYATIIGMTYYSLLLIGIDGTALLASAGILSLAISLGARDLLDDILSGLFIIFEGEFRVGDIIMVDDWRGTVLEIGIRTTKVEDTGQNVKVIRNSNISNVVNMTKKLSLVACNIGIEYEESLEHVETILAKELPEIAKRLPAIVKGPYYRGVTAFGDDSVDIRITMQCAEKDRIQLERDFNREIKLLFDRYDINIPFPQIVINQPSERRQATEEEKFEAELFNEEQKEAFSEEVRESMGATGGLDDGGDE